jgi:hypothetical protein
MDQNHVKFEWKNWQNHQFIDKVGKNTTMGRFLKNGSIDFFKKYPCFNLWDVPN